MTNRRLLTLVFGTLILLGTTLMVVTSNSKEAKGTATYAGQQTCMSSGCHADFKNEVYPGAGEYKKTMHANIHNRPNPQNVIIEQWFREKRSLKLYESKVHQTPGDTVYFDLKKGDKETDYFIQLRTTGQYADSTGWLKVAYNYGGNGWIQRFLVEVNGSYYPIPFQYVMTHYKATDNADGPIYFLDQTRWYKYDADKDAIIFFKFDSKEFLQESWDKRCVACHVNGFDVRSQVIKDDTVKQWFGEWVGSDGTDSAVKDINIAIGCESCHGPGSLHVAEPQNKEYQKALSPKQWDPTEQSFYWTEKKLEVCDQCHNRHSSTTNLHTYQYKDETNEPFVPGIEGDDLKDAVRDTVRDAQYWSDNKTSYAHHQTGQDYWRSAHYSKHIFKNGCYDCHTPHNNTEYPYQLNRNWYSLQKGEGCVAFGCHDTMANTIDKDGKPFNIHAQHLNEHSQCVNCHYTKTATIAFTGTFEFSDHSDQVIRPKATRDYADFSFGPVGLPNTCAMSCHRNGYGERNRPDAFDQNVSIKWGNPDVVPMKAPDFGVHDQNITNNREPSDIVLADSLWAHYKEMYRIYLTSVRVDNANLSATSAITSVSPNPTASLVRIKFNLVHAENIRLEIYNAQGKLIRVIAEHKHEPGSYEDEWNGMDEVNHEVPSGAYFVRLTGESFSSTKSVMLTR